MLTAVSVNWPAFVISIVVSMAWGFALFHRQLAGGWWMRQVGLDPDNLPKEAAMRSVGIAFALSIIQAVGFAIIFGWTGASGIVEGATVGILAGIAFGLPLGMVHPTFEGRPMGVGILYGAQHIIEFLMMGMIFGILT